MRVLYPVLLALLLYGCATAPQAVRGTMPLGILRAEGELPRMRPARLEAAGNEAGASFYFTVLFDGDDKTLGKASSVSWQISLEGYCRDKPTLVRSVLIGPSGRVWQAGQVFVPAGPDRSEGWSRGEFSYDNGVPGAPEVLEAVTAGGRFTLAIQDEDGQLWSPSLIDTLTPAQRLRLFAANRAAFEAPHSETVAAEGETPVIVANARPFRAPWPPRPCPETIGRS